MRAVASECQIRPFRVVENTTIQEDVNMAERRAVPRMRTIKEVVEMTGLSYTFLRQLCLEGRIVFIKTGKKYLINYDKFLEFLNTGA